MHTQPLVPYPAPSMTSYLKGKKQKMVMSYPVANAVDGFHIFFGHLASALASVTTQHTGCCTAKTWRLHSKINTQYLITQYMPTTSSNLATSHNARIYRS